MKYPPTRPFHPHPFRLIVARNHSTLPPRPPPTTSCLPYRQRVASFSHRCNAATTRRRQHLPLSPITKLPSPAAFTTVSVGLSPAPALRPASFTTDLCTASVGTHRRSVLRHWSRLLCRCRWLGRHRDGSHRAVPHCLPHHFARSQTRIVHSRGHAPTPKNYTYFMYLVFIVGILSITPKIQQ